MSLVATETAFCLNKVLREDEIVIAADNGWCRVEKNILAENSQFFQLLFLSQHSMLWKENIERLVCFNWLSIDVLLFLLKFLNNPGCCEIDPKLKLMQVVQVSDFFNVEQLKVTLCRYYETNVIQGFTKPTRDKLIKVISALRDTEWILPSLKPKCVNWLARYFSEAWSKSEYTKLPSSLKEEIYQIVAKTVNKLDGKTLVYVQEIEKLKAAVCSNTKSEAFILANRIQKEVNVNVLNNFREFVMSLTVIHVSRIVWLYDYLGNLLKYVGANLNVQNICEIYSANFSILQHGTFMEWKEETVLRRFRVLDDKCTNYCWRMVQIIKRDNPEGWNSLPDFLKEQTDSIHRQRQQSTFAPESNEGGFMFICIDDKPTTKPPTSLIRHTNRPARKPREDVIIRGASMDTQKSSRIVTKRNTLKKGKSTDSGTRAAIKPSVGCNKVNSTVVSKHDPSTNNKSTPEENKTPVHKRNTLSKPSLTEYRSKHSFPIPSSSSHSRLPIPTHCVRKQEHNYSPDPSIGGKGCTSDDVATAGVEAEYNQYNTDSIPPAAELIEEK